jgi:rhodanese-related sulfurtransferase
MSVFLLSMLAVSLFTVSAEEIQRITPEDLKKLIESKADIVIVDNQPKEVYDTGHIPTAVNFPWVVKIKGPVNLPGDKLLVFYCACAHEEDSSDLADQLMNELGYNNIKVLEGGWLRWVELGFPIEKK